jgi:hypothetical protein
MGVTAVNTWPRKVRAVVDRDYLEGRNFKVIGRIRQRIRKAGGGTVGYASVALAKRYAVVRWQQEPFLGLATFRRG